MSTPRFHLIKRNLVTLLWGNLGPARDKPDITSSLLTSLRRFQKFQIIAVGASAQALIPSFERFLVS